MPPETGLIPGSAPCGASVRRLAAPHRLTAPSISLAHAGTTPHNGDGYVFWNETIISIHFAYSTEPCHLFKNKVCQFLNRHCFTNHEFRDGTYRPEIVLNFFLIVPLPRIMVMAVSIKRSKTASAIAELPIISNLSSLPRWVAINKAVFFEAFHFSATGVVYRGISFFQF